MGGIGRNHCRRSRRPAVDVLKIPSGKRVQCRHSSGKPALRDIRWIENKEEVDVKALTGTSDMKKVMDDEGNPLSAVYQQLEYRQDPGQKRRPCAGGIFQKLRKEVRKRRFLREK